MRWSSPALVSLLPLLLATSCGSPPAPMTLPVADAADRLAAPAPKEPNSARITLLLPPEERPTIPGFDGATAWINVERPLDYSRDVLGRIAVVDFWTSCCINCIHTLPVLAEIEERFRDEPVVVVGVHSPKFEEERDADRLREVIRSQDIKHPVAVDAKMAIWDAWGIRAWPTVAVVDAEGKLVWATQGEPDPNELTAAILEALGEAREKKTLASGPPRGMRAETTPPGPLRYPGKVITLEGGGFAVADTGHHRIVLTDRSGTATAIVGSGAAGAKDGSAENASFRLPQGLAEVGGDLYVADTGNHLLRKIDKATRAVTTVAGTGSIGLGPLSKGEKEARKVGLRSPWDVLHHAGNVYVALAGSHQIGVFDPKQGTMRLYAGDGREAREDGTALEAAFAQPSALATDKKSLFVLDSETSSVRAIELASGNVSTIVGVDLFVFGDVDGDASKARLQHPLGMTYGKNSLFVADSYNGKVKRIDPAKRTSTSVLTGLGEPGGVALDGDDLVVVDTFHHRLVRRAITAKGEAKPIVIAGLSPPKPIASKQDSGGAELVLAPVLAPAKGASKLHLDWGLPKGTALNDEAYLRLAWSEADGLARVPENVRTTGASAKGGLDVSIEPASDRKSATLEGTLELVLCDDIEHRVCVPLRRTLRIPLTFEASAQPAKATVPLPPAQ